MSFDTPPIETDFSSLVEGITFPAESDDSSFLKFVLRGFDIPTNFPVSFTIPKDFATHISQEIVTSFERRARRDLVRLTNYFQFNNSCSNPSNKNLVLIVERQDDKLGRHAAFFRDLSSRFRIFGIVRL